ncbi:MAG: hypothetical protein JSV88_16675 [Candidatus Aminicenantes bacterium]|nr:MAG: hypothetical protein JSV88_16675 [Candidatus Aminicenantes bacterium]
MTKPKLKERMLTFFITEVGLRWTVRVVIALIIGAAFLFESLLGWGHLRSALTVSGVASVAILFITSRKLHNRIYYRSILGFWEFEVTPRNPNEKSLQKLINQPIAILIDLDRNELRLRGWHFEKKLQMFFSSTQAVISDPARTSGTLTYWFRPSESALLDEAFIGVCNLEWNKFHIADRICRMDGFWIRKNSHQTGTITYKRISEDEFRKRLSGLQVEDA